MGEISPRLRSPDLEHCRKMSAPDTEKLIQAVQKRPALYDKSERDHSDRDIKANLWEAIQAELEVNVDGKNLIF